MNQLNKWYKDGLIDPDVLTIDDAGVRSKALNQKIGIAFTSMSQMTNWVFDAQKNKLSANKSSL
jgi:putative aldouronate transport system substrate-binding protein